MVVFISKALNLLSLGYLQQWSPTFVALWIGIGGGGERVYFHARVPLVQMQLCVFIQQAADQQWATDWGLGTPDQQDYLCLVMSIYSIIVITAI